MGKTYSEIDDRLGDFIRQQAMFFVATAPLSAEGHVNVSPKGIDSFLIEDSHTVVYCDLVGSGIETVAHLQENGRIVIMFCAFSGSPKIVRLHGYGKVITSGHADYSSLVKQFPALIGIRCFIRIHCQRISVSCGFGVPLFEYQGQRTELEDWAKRKGEPQLAEYVRTKNATSIDGLPGLQVSE